MASTAPSLRPAPLDCPDLLLGRTVLWLLGAPVLCLLTVGTLTDDAKLGTGIGLGVCLAGAIANFWSRWSRGRGLAVRAQPPAAAFALGYPSAVVVGSWYTHVHGYGVSGVSVAVLVAALAGAVALPFTALALPGHGLGDREMREARATSARRSALILTAISVIASFVGGIGLFFVPEALAFWFIRRGTLRDLGLEIEGIGRGLRRIAKAVGVVIVLYILLLIGFFAADPLGLGGSPLDVLFRSPPDAPSTLLSADPFMATRPNTVEGQTAEVMAHRYPRYHFVSPNSVSTGPKVVSVNAIDAYDWGAAALGRNGRCYALVWVLDRVQPQYGGSRYGFIPRGEPCQASFATSDRITGEHW
jgi:MFS family permease